MVQWRDLEKGYWWSPLSQRRKPKKMGFRRRGMGSGYPQRKSSILQTPSPGEGLRINQPSGGRQGSTPSA